MKKLICLLGLGLFALSAAAQENLYLDAFLTKWENSKTYMVQVAQSMPDSLYGFKPTEREMSFKEQLLHITENINNLGHYLDGNRSKAKEATDANEKTRIIANLENAFDHVAEEVQKFPAARLAEKVDFFAGEKNLLQILNLLQDHVTHHRGQLIVYLNLNGIKPPPYTGW